MSLEAVVEWQRQLAVFSQQLHVTQQRATDAEAAVLSAVKARMASKNQAQELLNQAGRAIRQAKQQREAALQRAAVADQQRDAAMRSAADATDRRNEMARRLTEVLKAQQRAQDGRDV